MTIELIPITTDYLPECSGVYLVKTVTHYLKKNYFLQAVVRKYQNNKGEWEYSIDVRNQTPVAISSKPIL